MNIVIDSMACEAVEGETLMQVAKRNNIHIPGLCHHEAVPGQACCRLCLVEVGSQAVQGEAKEVVVSCIYPVAPDIAVVTNSEKIKALRKNVLTMVRESAPQAEGLSALYEEYGVTLDERFCLDESNKCVMCGLCVKACQKLGASAISTVLRGVDKKISTPFDKPSSDCTGCGSCARVCPVNAIEVVENQNQRQIWGKTFELASCGNCGAPVATLQELDMLISREALAKEQTLLCAKCKKKLAVSAF